MDKLYLFASLLVIYTLFFLGLIGPKKWRILVKNFNKWYYYDAKEIILPIDSGKPLIEAAKEGVKKIPDRIKQMEWLPGRGSPMKGSYAILIIFELFVLLATLAIFIAWN